VFRRTREAYLEHETAKAASNLIYKDGAQSFCQVTASRSVVPSLA
jgi:hypothetical protein